ncbi:hypothetical protein HK105_204043 [Polyrhizophydium stewartii]|uniref:3-oxo-5-alpha-steroid 4-dehydrogenase C-terminal domain-containing protein n=1 Tax=Polyrhizophydium stewartii TaxID=2732419 RepID=A0ABR4N9V8_9FUNG|nr:hypothetical protein HK105_001195 [Polyrhizophydium stewartii]
MLADTLALLVWPMRGAFAAAIAVGAASKAVPAIADSLLASGKTYRRPRTQTGETTSTAHSTSLWKQALAALEAASVPKAWFEHFYLLGAAWNALLGACLLAMQATGAAAVPAHLWLVWTMIETQLVRRVVECRMWPSAGSRMNVMYYLVGVFFYIGMPPTLLIEGAAAAAAHRPAAAHPAAVAVAVAQFVVGSVVQNRVHAQLASMRRKLGSGTAAAAAETRDAAQPPKLKYPLPTGPLFALVACPHYTSEIVIYLSFFGLSGFSDLSAAIVAVFVATGLFLTADQQYNWYMRMYPKDAPPGWKRIIPFVF